MSSILLNRLRRRAPAADLATAHEHEAALAAELVAARLLLDPDVQVQRVCAAERRADTAEAELATVREQLRHADAVIRGLRRQLTDAFGYTPEQLAAIASGTGEPRSAISR